MSHRSQITFARILFFAAFAIGLLFVACSIPLPPLDTDGQEPNEIKTKNDIPKAKELDVFPGQSSGSPSVGPTITHLNECDSDADCGSGIPPSGGKQRCANLFGTPTCFFPCDPKKGVGEKLNPDCLRPENCVSLSDGSGLCIYVPGQLYGIGSYGAITRHKPGDLCLVKFGGCPNGYRCIDDRRHGSIGRCIEECLPPLKGRAPSVCSTPNTTCKKLASGFGGCLPN